MEVLFLDKNENFNSTISNEIVKNLLETNVSLYPDYNFHLATLSNLTSLDPAYILPTSGCTEAIRSSIDCFVDASTICLTRTNTYSYAIESLKHKTNRLSFYDEPDDMFSYFFGPKKFVPQFLYICNPNNPTGCFYSIEELTYILELCYKKDCYIFLDETYIDFIDADNTELVKTFPNLMIGRSFSKAWGCAGLRMGYILSNPRNIKMLDQFRLKASINSVGVQAVNFLVKNKHFVDEMIKNIKTNFEILSKFIIKNGGKVLNSNNTNFVYFKSHSNMFAKLNCKIRSLGNELYTACVPSEKHHITRFLSD